MTTVERAALIRKIYAEPLPKHVVYKQTPTDWRARASWVARMPWPTKGVQAADAWRRNRGGAA